MHGEIAIIMTSLCHIFHDLVYIYIYFLLLYFSSLGEPMLMFLPAPDFREEMEEPSSISVPVMSLPSKTKDRPFFMAADDPVIKGRNLLLYSFCK